MKWSDLSFKEKKQIYDSIKAQNPDTTYLDIKSQFDSIPGYEDGKDNSVAAVYSLPEVTVYPQNKFGDIARTQGYETAKNWQTVRNATTAGINEFVNDPRTQMALAAVPMPSGIEVLSDAINIGKSASKSKQLFYHGSPVRFDKFDAQFIGSAEGGSKAMKGINLWYKSPKNAPKFANIKSPDAPIHFGRSSKPLVREIDKAYNTNYEKAYSDIAYKEITGRKDYVSYGSMGDNIYGKANMKNIQDGFTSSNVDDYSIVLDPSTYMPSTANHELGHMADGIAGSIKYEAEPGVDYITNPYLRYLADPDNTYTTKELRDAGFHSAARNKRYLLNPTESKSHMLTLKRALKDSNKISKWSDPVDENMILDYFRSGRANGAVRNQYDLYIDKQRYIDRLNRLVPMEWLLPTIGLGGAEFLREKQNNKSN